MDLMNSVPFCDIVGLALKKREEKVNLIIQNIFFPPVSCHCVDKMITSKV